MSNLSKLKWYHFNIDCFTKQDTSLILQNFSLIIVWQINTRSWYSSSWRTNVFNSSDLILFFARLKPHKNESLRNETPLHIIIKLWEGNIRIPLSKISSSLWQDLSLNWRTELSQRILLHVTCVQRVVGHQTDDALETATHPRFLLQKCIKMFTNITFADVGCCN